MPDDLGVDYARRVTAERELTARDQEVIRELLERPIPTPSNTAGGFTCPECEMTSYNPHDVAEGYCGNCHAWTRR